MPGPLTGVTVLDLSTVGPGSRCSALLADLGADVVKVVPPAGVDRIQPAAWAYSGGRGTRRVELDLKAAPDAFLELARDTRVVVESFRPGVADRLGIGYDAVAAVNPDIVYAALTGYGQTGPYAAWAGHDLNYQAVAGALATQQRRADGGPALPGVTFADSAGGGMHAALAICAALVAGAGTYLDVAAVDGVLGCTSMTIDEHLHTGADPGPGHDVLTGRYACYDVYPTGDGRWLAVGAIESRFWANLCRALGLDRWIDRQHDDAVQDEIRADVRRALATRDRDAWVGELGPADTCVAPVNAIAEVVRDPHLRARVDGRFVGRVVAT